MRAGMFLSIFVAVFGIFAAVASAEYMPTVPVAGSLPADAVAIVESTPITKQAFDHAYDVRKRFASGKLTAKERLAARSDALTSLIDAARTRIEANSKGISVSDATATKRFQTLKKQSFPKKRDYTRFLSEYGQTESDLIELVRASIYKERLQAAWSAAVVVTDQEVIEEYAAHPNRYDIPATRDVVLIFTTKRATIYKALAALKRGRSFKRVAAKYSADRVSAKNGGRFPGVQKRQFPRSLDRAVFKAERGKLIGPIKTQYGYYLARVTRINKARPRTFEQAREDIYESLLEYKQLVVTDTGQEMFERRWKPATICRTGYVAKVCGVYADGV